MKQTWQKKKINQYKNVTTQFYKKELPETKRVCLRLKELREAKKISLEEISKRSLICVRYLQALEDCQFNKIPFAPIYQKNFIRSYAEALNVDPTPFVEQYNHDEITNHGQKKFAARPIKKTLFANLPSAIRSSAIALVAILFVSYLGWQIKSIIKPPALNIYSPDNGLITNHTTLTVSGRTEHDARVTINGQDIDMDNKGEFKEPIVLTAGMNTIVVSAKKKHGKETLETRRVILRDNHLSRNTPTP